MPGYSQLVTPVARAKDVTPSGSDVEVSPQSRAVYVGSAGDLVVDMATVGTQITFAGVTSGSVLPLAITKVYDSGTTAGDIRALW